MNSEHYFKKREIALWCVSVFIIVLSFAIFDRENLLTLIASLVGVTSLILNAKGNPLGQLLMVIFSILYGIISYSFSYYGEMITYLGMTMPMAALALVSWLCNPYQGKRSEVAVNKISRQESWFAIGLALLVTFLFYWILRAFHTANLFLSTLSVTTSFLAVYLTFRRSAWFAIAYAANDVVLVVLWTLAANTVPSYWSVVACFAAFLANDLYGYISWRKMAERQQQ